MIVRKSFQLCMLALASLSVGCGYAVSVNERVVYTPPSLFTDYKIADAVLAACVEQSIVDSNASKASDLKRLNCSSAGIESLAGLRVFSGIEELNLAENRLTDVSELGTLSQLKVLLLNSNTIASAAPLLTLLKLERVDLTGNPSLPCNDLAQLQRNYAGQKLVLAVPAHCS